MVEVNVAVTLGLACERMLFGGAGIAKLLGRAALRWVFRLDFWRKSRTKRLFWRLDAQPSAEIVRVESAKCRRECDLSHARANPPRRSCVSSARNAGESALSTRSIWGAGR